MRNADKIVVLGAGSGILEQGTHDQLVALPNGHYNALLAAASRAVKNHAAGDAHVNANEDDADEDSSRVTKTGSVKKSEEKLASITGSDTSSRRRGCCGKNKKKKSNEPKVTFSRLYREFSRPEGWYYFPATFAMIINGAQLPVFSILFAGISNVYFLPTSELIQDQANLFAIYFLAFSVIAFYCNFSAFALGGMIGERMITRLRTGLFVALLKQDMAFYDDKENSIGSILSRLSTDAALVKTSMVDRSNLLIMNLTTAIVGLTIAFYYGNYLPVLAQ